MGHCSLTSLLGACAATVQGSTLSASTDTTTAAGSPGQQIFIDPSSWSTLFEGTSSSSSSKASSNVDLSSLSDGVIDVDMSKTFTAAMRAVDQIDILTQDVDFSALRKAGMAGGKGSSHSTQQPQSSAAASPPSPLSATSSATSASSAFAVEVVKASPNGPPPVLTVGEWLHTQGPGPAFDTRS